MMNSDIKLPPNGKPYNLLTIDEVASFNHYRKNGGKLGVKVCLKSHYVENLGMQLIVVVKNIKAVEKANKQDLIDTLIDLNISRCDDSYVERIKHSNAATIGELYAIPTRLADNSAPQNQQIIHHYSNKVVQNNHGKVTTFHNVNKDQYIVAPKSFMDRVKILFGLY